jgi:MFS family permease
LAIARGQIVFLTVSAIFFFASAITFASLGMITFAMQQIFHWSDGQAGGAFLVLGLATCLSALAPVAAIARFGARWTICAGIVLLAAGALVAAGAHGLALYYIAIGLLGPGFSMSATTAGLYLISGWHGTQAGRLIGLYLMAGTLGNAAGPPAVSWLIALSGGWRGYWLVMACVSVLLTGLAALLLRDPSLASATTDNGAGLQGWPLRKALTSRQFTIIAACMVATQACLLTVASVAAPHLVNQGGSSAFAATILSVQALVGTGATGLGGWLAEHRDPRLILAGGMLVQAAAILLLAFADIGWPTCLFAVLFGIGWALACLAVTVLLISYFGTRAGTTALSSIWMLSGLAALAPSAAGMVADRMGSFTPALAALGLLLMPLAAAGFAMRAPSTVLE